MSSVLIRNGPLTSESQAVLAHLLQSDEEHQPRLRSVLGSLGDDTGDFRGYVEEYELAPSLYYYARLELDRFPGNEV